MVTTQQGKMMPTPIELFIIATMWLIAVCVAAAFRKIDRINANGTRLEDKVSKLQCSTATNSNWLANLSKNCDDQFGVMSRGINELAAPKMVSPSPEFNPDSVTDWQREIDSLAAIAEISGIELDITMRVRG